MRPPEKKYLAVNRGQEKTSGVLTHLLRKAARVELEENETVGFKTMSYVCGNAALFRKRLLALAIRRNE
jgi:hypothetical protein